MADPETPGRHGEVRFVDFQADGTIGRLTLRRPDKLNAQSHRMWAELRTLGAELEKDHSIRVLVVSGEGRSFSAGLDVEVLAAGTSSATEPDLEGLRDEEFVSRVQESFTWLERAPFATIAAVQGHALGAGLQLALACDLRVAAADASLGLLELRWGLMPDLGATVWLPRLVGPAKALELIWTSDRIDAHEALALGIVNKVVPRDELEATTTALAEQVAAAPPIAVRTSKRAVYGGLMPTATGVSAAAVAQAECLRSADFVEAGRAYLEGRPPRYVGR